MSILADAIAANNVTRLAKELIVTSEELERLRKIELAAMDLLAVKGKPRETDIAYKQLEEALK